MDSTKIIIILACSILSSTLFCICARSYIKHMNKIREKHRLNRIRNEANNYFKSKIKPVNSSCEEFKDEFEMSEIRPEKLTDELNI